MSAMWPLPTSRSVKLVNRWSQFCAAKSRPGGPKAAFIVTGRGFCTEAGRLTAPFSLIMHAVKIDRRVAVVGLDDDVDPLLRLHIGIFHQRHAEHVELVRIPAANDVQSGAAVADVIDGRQRLCRIERMQQRHMHGHEQRDALGDAPQARPPR